MSCRSIKSRQITGLVFISMNWNVFIYFDTGYKILYLAGLFKSINKFSSADHFPEPLESSFYQYYRRTRGPM